MGARTIWSETLAYETLRSARVLALLAKYRLGVTIAVRPPDLADIGRTLRACADRGIAAGVWPMLDDADGRWANVESADRYVAFAGDVMRAIDRAGARTAEIAVDLEPPIAALRAFSRRLFRGSAHVVAHAGGKDAFEHARGRFVGLAREAEDRGVRAVAAVAPLVLFDAFDAFRARAPREVWQRLLGTPVRGPAWRHVSVMMYTSIVCGWSRGLVSRRGVRPLLAAACRGAARRFGGVGGVSLGVVGTGALGDEPTYASPADLADDVGIARASGIDDLALFDLGGVLARPPPEVWLDAFCETPASFAPADSVLVRAVRVVDRLGTG